jgi:hypothetical protein
MPALTFTNFKSGIDLRRSDQVVDNNGLRECNNAYVTGGYGVQKRPGIDLITSSAIPSGAKDLFYFDGELYSVSSTPVLGPSLSGYGVPPAAGTLNILVLPDLSDPLAVVEKVWQFMPFNRKLYVIVEYNNGNILHFYDGLQITDTNCPNSKSAVVHDSKIYAIDVDAAGSGYVKYSATGDPTDWSKIRDASGTLGIPVGQETPDEELIAVFSFRDKLMVFMENSIQLWKTDPDPTLIELDTVIQNANLKYRRSMGNAGTDVYYLNEVTFESLGQKLYTDTLQSNDIGAAIQPIVSAQIDLMASTYEPIAVYLSGFNQYVCAIADQIYVYSFSESSKLAAWSRYTMPENVDGIATYRNYLYIRCNDHIFSFNPSSFEDTLSTGSTSNINVEIESSFQTLKSSGIWKQIFGADILVEGSANVQYKYDARTPSSFTAAQAISGDSRPGLLLPVELMTTEVGFKITQAANSNLLFNGITFYYNNLGVF